VLHLDVLRAERWNRQARQDMARLQRRSIQEILDNPAQRGVVILGDPGSGKTTLLHYQALRTARASGDGSAARASLPIFVPLAAYDDFLRRTQKDCSLGDFLAVYYDQWHSLPGLTPLFQHALAEGRALVLLDGLDEVLDTTTRQFVAEQAGALIRQWAPRGNLFAVTSRIVGYREARLPGDLTHVTVLDFGRTEIEIFAHQWCRSYEA
jgi:predicted NACHT family NTPase